MRDFTVEPMPDDREKPATRGSKKDKNGLATLDLALLIGGLGVVMFCILAVVSVTIWRPCLKRKYAVRKSKYAASPNKV